MTRELLIQQMCLSNMHKLLSKTLQDHMHLWTRSNGMYFNITLQKNVKTNMLDVLVIRF